MIAARIRPEHIVLAWRDLGPMLQRAQAADQPLAMDRLRLGDADLWAVIENARPIGAVVTEIKGDRCLMWQIAGSRVREWAALLVATVKEWARARGCVALYGCGRKGWARIVEPLGFERIEDIDGRPTWELQIGELQIGKLQVGGSHA